MGKLILRNDILEKIKSNPYILADIAVCLNYSTAYVLRLIREKDEKLTQASVLRIIKGMYL